jgi:proteasome lid subunit RPN8/RPN11
VEAEAARLGQQLLGFYHSHPDHPARPSQYDLDHAFPFFWYVIVSIQQARPEKMTVWLLADDRSQFHEAELQT